MKYRSVRSIEEMIIVLVTKGILYCRHKRQKPYYIYIMVFHQIAYNSRCGGCSSRICAHQKEANWISFEMLVAEIRAVLNYGIITPNDRSIATDCRHVYCFHISFIYFSTPAREFLPLCENK